MPTTTTAPVLFTFRTAPSLESIIGDLYDRDPNGWEHRRPGAEDYRAFEAYAVATYGAESLERYYAFSAPYSAEV